ncbi:MAG TPA: 3-deoxy-7-phosphoheptulonate synthase [Candidatus Bathyarchaeota archaeon]|nr:3-deoxy-7-phosphoheptulonate synthase [Candidatus Bathyarchaeota archaeon]
MRIGKGLKLSVKTEDGESRVVTVGDLEVGSDLFVVIAGPCSVESREQILDTAREVKRAGAHMLRGGAFKPRTSPYSFQGLGVEGLKLLAEAREETGLPVVTEVMAPEQVRVVSEYADVLQIGARNMQNFPLLREVGRCRKPVLLKRGLWATVEEWLCAAEYIMVEGNLDVILCERGIRTFEKATRNTLDLSAVALLKHVSPLPVIVDPSHGTGVRELVTSMAKASAAAGADGIMVEVHPRPEEALSDGPQSLRFEEFRRLMEGLRPVVEAVGRRV